MTETLVTCENIGKTFCRDLKKSLWYGVKDSAADLFGWMLQSGSHRSAELAPSANDDSLRAGEFWANRNISFEVKRGECLGLIGRNGAGKTTLLKMLNGLIKPDVGRIEMRGRVGAMIALGAGFNPVLTARENIYVNGSVLGLSRRQISDRLDDIVEFASLEEFVDSPVRTFSSGMQVRLGFAVASTLSPDVLIIDEVLAVGDAAFRSKCFGRIAELLDHTAVILVSHNMNAISNICTRAVVMDGGIIRHEGEVDDVIQVYNRINEGESAGGFVRLTPPIDDLSYRLSEHKITTGDSLGAAVSISCADPVPDTIIRLVIYNESNAQVAELGSQFNSQPLELQRGDNHIQLQANSIQLKAGRYFVSICVSKGRGLGIIGWDHLNQTIEVSGSHYGFSGYQLPGSFTHDNRVVS